MNDDDQQLDGLLYPWTRSTEEVLAALEVTVDRGLDARDVRARLERHGHNALRQVQSQSRWRVFLSQFESPVIWLLAAATVVSLLFGEMVEAGAICAVIVINTVLGFFTELRAIRSMEALRHLVQSVVHVRRGGEEQEIAARDLVPGDVVIIEAGDVVAADIRLIEQSRLQADESTLTGESVPVGKAIGVLDDDTPVAGRKNMLHSGTAVTRGSGVGVVVATGMDTELGTIARLVDEAEQEVTPLEKRLERLSRKLIWLVLGIAVLASTAGIATGKNTFLMIETGIALAVAAIPAGLPIVATLALAQGMWHMARRNVLVNRLSSVETLGATTTIFTDKTGTLTENQMTVTEIATVSGQVHVTGEGLTLTGEFRRRRRAQPGDPDDRDTLDRITTADDPCLTAVLEVAVLCGNAAIHRRGNGDDAGDDEGVEGDVAAVGDPLEVALLVAGAKAGLERRELLARWPEVREEAFDPATRAMATFHERDGGYLVAVKGACEVVLESSTAILTPTGVERLEPAVRERWLGRNHELAGDGFRVLAVARKSTDSIDESPYSGLTFIGLVAMIDPPRTSVRDSITACRGAGIQVVMVTGDQQLTAHAVASELGLDEGDVFARVDPAEKLEIIRRAQARGEVVAMTGDGVNDAPALRKADIGVAMGIRGTEVAREASDMILQDDSFASIVAAIQQGRAIFHNIRRFVVYLLSCNVSEIIIVTGAAMINMPMPILPLQILFLNLVTDMFPALALGVSAGDPRIMQQPPRDPSEPILARRHWVAIAIHGVVITMAVMAALVFALTVLDYVDSRATTVSFLTLALAQLWHVFNMREPGSSFLRNDVMRNPMVWGALGLCLVILASAVYIPFLSEVLHMRDPGAAGWLVAFAMSLIPWVIGQLRLSAASNSSHGSERALPDTPAASSGHGDR